MHYHCEILLPPGTDVEAGVRAAMAPFDENERDSECARGSPFWDWYVIGGRMAGSKLLAKFDSTKIDAFYEWCKEEKITVSGFICGKQELKPESQIPKVDAKWNEMFGTTGSCPLFNHFNKQYGKGLDGADDGDVCRLGDLPKALKACRVIIVTPQYNGKLGPEFMLSSDHWNGCNHMPVKWDGTISDALAQYSEKIGFRTEEAKKKLIVNDDWLVVTVDYHS